MAGLIRLNAQDIALTEPVRFLALGDSYTIGESVPEAESWPHQLFDSLAARGYQTEQLDIIARTGWTTGVLTDVIETRNPSKDYNLVSLLIGVNDQYQGLPIEWYAPGFEDLLLTAIELAGGNKDAVFVLSIPDYAYTPFGAGSGKTSQEIDAYNEINQSITQSYGIAYFDITPISREGFINPGLVAGDGLHPSGLMYSRWVSLMLETLLSTAVTDLKPIQQEINRPIVAPNPASDSVHFILNDIKGDGVRIRVYNVSGHLLASLKSENQSIISFNTAGLSPGIYYYHMINENGKVFSGKFIRV
jgi:lysophospholipase L1-like esterase